MQDLIADKLAERGTPLPEVIAPLAAYVPALTVGSFVYTSGQVPFVDGKLLVSGHVGAEVSPEEAEKQAEICVLNALAAIKAQIGSLDRVKQVVKLTGFVNSDPEFTGQPGVINGGSNLLKEVFGEKGAHARSAVGVASLPLGASVEIELTVEIEA